MKELLNLIQLNDIKTIKKLLNNKLYTQKEKNKALKEAAFLGNINIMKLLIKAGANVNAPNNNILKAAVQGNHLESVKFLISQGAIINKKNLLLEAAKIGNLDIYKYLEKAGAPYKNSPEILVEAVSYNNGDNSEFIKYLVKNNNYRYDTIFGSLQTYTKQVEFLVNCVLDYTKPSFNLATYCFFLLLSKPGTIATIKRLYNYGVDIYNVRNDYSPLAYILNHGNNDLDLINFFIEQGFPLMPDDEIWPLERAITSFNPSIEVVKYLIKKGTNPFLKEESIVCYSTKSTKIFNYFRDLGLNIHVNDNCAMLEAIKYNNFDVVKQLITTPLEKNKLNMYLCHSLKNLNIKMAEYFINKGANVHEIEPEEIERLKEIRNYPVSYECVKFFIDIGIDVNFTSNLHLTNSEKETLTKYKEYKKIKKI